MQISRRESQLAPSELLRYLDVGVGGKRMLVEQFHPNKAEIQLLLLLQRQYGSRAPVAQRQITT